MKNIYECKILLVDDNEDLLAMIEEILRKEGYLHIVTAKSCSDAYRVFESDLPDLGILDVMLPDGDGFSLFRKIREKWELPLLFLSARDEDNDRLLGLGLGADDYITKPFLPQELLLRISAILKRTYFFGGNTNAGSNEKKLVLGSKTVNFDNATVIDGNGNEVTFTAKELLLMKKLNSNRGNIVTFDSLCQAAWGDQYYGYENTLMVHIRHLREKVEEDPSHPVWILTARGIGYRLAK